jgi:hypothetical protein
MQHISSYFGFINALRDGDGRQCRVRLGADLGPQVSELLGHLRDVAQGGLLFGAVEIGVNLQDAAGDDLGLVGLPHRNDVIPVGDCCLGDAESLTGGFNRSEMRNNISFEHNP